MTTDGTCFIPKGWLTMLLQLLWDDDNWQSRFHTLGMYNHTLSVVIREWQLTEQDSYLMNTSPCSDRFNEPLTTDRTCLLSEWYITMLWPLSWNNDNWRSLFHTLEINYHALSVVMNDNLIVTVSACTINRRPCSDTWIHAPSQWVFKLPLGTCTITCRFHSDSWVHVPSQGGSIVALECSYHH